MAPWRAARAKDVRTAEALAREGYELYGGEMYGYALNRLGDDSAAQDAVQETIVRAWRAAQRFDPARGSLRTWLYAILRNVVTDQVAARRRLPLAVVDRIEERVQMIDDHAGAFADADLVARALRTISADHRTAIVETYLRDRTYDDVAAELGVSVSTLRSRVFYGLKQLTFAVDTMEVER